MSSAEATDAAPKTEADLEATLVAENAEAETLRPKAELTAKASTKEPNSVPSAAVPDTTTKVADAAETPADTAEPAETQLALAPVAKKPTSAFAAFMKANQAGRRRSPSTGRESVTGSVAVRNTGSSASTARAKPRLVARSRNRSDSTNALPGVNTKRVFAIEEDANPDVSERKLDVTLRDPIRVAAVTNLARRGTHGLLLQRSSVKVGCFPPQLVSLLKQVERKFGRTPVVTSGYRSPSYNRKIRGAKNSQHVQCKAADIQVKGVSKWTVARYLRTLPGRGGVGTYCHTNSVHIDVGSERDWNRKCRRKRRRA